MENYFKNKYGKYILGAEQWPSRDWATHRERERDRELRQQIFLLPDLQQDPAKDEDCGVQKGGDFYTVLGPASRKTDWPRGLRS